jgi:hypothetical protein
MGFEPTTFRTTIGCSNLLSYNHHIEEGVRFELTELLHSQVFKTSAIDHSANPPYCGHGRSRTYVLCCHIRDCTLPDVPIVDLLRFELKMTEPKSDVLPLHHRSI